MKPYAFVLAACTAAAVSVAAPAVAGEKEIIAIANNAMNDSVFGSLSFRYALGESLDNGLIVRGDLSRSRYGFSMGATDVTGTVDTARLMMGYATGTPDQILTVYGGLTARDRSHSPLVGGLTDESDVSVFASAEYFYFSDKIDTSAMVEYDGAFGTFYTQAYAVMPFGSIKLGPTANYVSEGEYTREALGLRAQIFLAENTELVTTAAYAQGRVTGAADTNSSYVEMQLAVKF